MEKHSIHLNVFELSTTEVSSESVYDDLQMFEMVQMSLRGIIGESEAVSKTSMWHFSVTSMFVGMLIGLTT